MQRDAASRNRVIDRFGLCLIAAILVMACDREPEPLPSVLLGGWTTDASRYRDRTFEIRPNAVVIGTGKYSANQLYLLVGVEKQPPAKNWSVYRLSYREHDASIADLVIHHRSMPKTQLRFANHQEIWTRVPSKGNDDV